MINLKEKVEAFFMNMDKGKGAEPNISLKKIKSMLAIIVPSMFIGGILALTLLTLKLIWQMRYPACIDFLIK